MVGCAEIYGRTPENDAHHEKFKPTMTQIFPSSLPQPFTRYTNIEIKIIQNDSSSKLVLRSKTMNALITSSIRIDTSLVTILVVRLQMDLNQPCQLVFSSQSNLSCGTSPWHSMLDTSNYIPLTNFLSCVSAKKEAPRITT
ncbi:hypothetical protein G6F57_012811 [Rhizopus arrhizus]|uniref:Uncharacterized protein n=1 Tax=Rhizopus oryzae TaxID=64495 RepID=A0A9P6WYB0_RHIOR|nr:hypothetical protein G6F23_010390 [Rhizopus arrhizus]KAG1399794.1 hypothetical protein G6F58_011063 [Rhizopus delemar]KAG0780852.1 hypothetical protein G6F21_011942 [Rhizopus arrhizus]KAG0821061.1 hypothetical protein G6F19_012127 [Rhizopus arrhizus]KAG0821663.1 hypothetical protein G6F18_012095 [Rhizopus arrhizus]